MKFANLPTRIKNWLGSDEVTERVIELNSKLDSRGGKESVMPNLILKLALSDLDIRNFMTELSRQLDLSLSSARIITREIKEKILEPIKEPFKELGIDIEQILLAPAELPPSIERQPIEVPKMEFTKPTTTPEPPRISDIKTQPIEKPTKTGEISPYVIYKEIKTFKVPITISEQKSATVNNDRKYLQGSSSTNSETNFSSLRAAKNIVEEQPFSPLPQTEKMNLQQLLESKKNNIVSSRQTPPTPLSGATVPPIASRQIPPTPLSGERIPIKPEQKTATMLPKNFQQKSDLQPNPPTVTVPLRQNPALRGKLTKARVVHYSDLRTPLNSV